MNDLTLGFPTPSTLLKKFLDQHPGLETQEFYEKTVAAVEDTFCVCCGVGIRKGEPGHECFVPDSFVDSAFLHACGGDQKRGLFCPDCKMAIGLRQASMQFSYAQIGVDPESGRFKAFTVIGMEDLLAAVYKPLSPPMVMTRKTRKRQHTIWKGKVNLHDVTAEDFLFFNSGDSTVVMHPARVLGLVEKEQELIQAVQEHVAGLKNAKGLKEIFPVRLLKVNLDCPSFVPANYRSPYVGITCEKLLARLDRFVQVVNESTSGDRILYAYLRTLGVFKKTTNYRLLVDSLVPREIDMDSVINGKSDSEENE